MSPLTAGVMKKLRPRGRWQARQSKRTRKDIKLTPPLIAQRIKGPAGDDGRDEVREETSKLTPGCHLFDSSEAVRKDPV